MFEILKLSVGAKRIQARPQEDAGVESLFVALLEPHHRLLGVTERRIDDRDLCRIRITGPRAFLQVAENLLGFVPPA